MAPIHFLLPAVLHVIWVILAIVTAVARGQTCHAPDSQTYYVVLLWGLFLIFVLSAIGEWALVFVGFRGKPPHTNSYSSCMLHAAQHCPNPGPTSLS